MNEEQPLVKQSTTKTRGHNDDAVERLEGNLYFPEVEGERVSVFIHEGKGKLSPTSTPNQSCFITGFSLFSTCSVNRAAI